MIQVHKFDVKEPKAYGMAAYVVHGLTFNKAFSRLKVSVWFDASGNVLDCEGFDSLGRSRPVPPKLQKVLPAEFGFVCALHRKQESLR